ncbi:MAG: tetratricopeptide repeat protein [Magnetococcales bacterium]|nr:tetratricopeptide repeat protein [Magnetococcales bacterium]
MKDAVWPSSTSPALLILAVVSLAYANSLQVPLLFDDILNIGNNPSIHSILPLTQSLDPPASTGLMMRPLSNFTYALSWAMGGLERIWPHHLVNLIIHLLAVLTLFGLLRRLLELPRLRALFPDGTAWPAALATLAWGLHPLLVHGVTYLSGRSAILMALFLLLTHYCALRGWTTSDRGRERRWTVLALGAFLLGLGANETMVAAPFVLFFTHWFFFPDSWRRILWQGRILHGGMALALVAMTVTILLRLDLKRWAGTVQPQDDPLLYALNQPRVLFHYLQITFWPTDLVMDYSWTPQGPAQAWPWVAAFLILVGLTLVGAARRRLWAFALGWFLLVMAPLHSVLPMVHNYPLEYRAYLSSSGPLIFVVLAGDRLLARGSALARTLRRPLWLALLGTLGVFTLLRNTLMASPPLLWEENARLQPQSRIVRLQAGSAWHAVGQFEKALVHFQALRERYPRLFSSHLNTAAMLLNLGRFAEAEEPVAMALRIAPGDPNAQSNLGALRNGQGRYREAVELLQGLVARHPEHGNAHYHLAVAFQALGETVKALAEVDKALVIHPQHRLYRKLRGELTGEGEPAAADAGGVPSGLPDGIVINFAAEPPR